MMTTMISGENDDWMKMMMIMMMRMMTMMMKIMRRMMTLLFVRQERVNPLLEALDIFHSLPSLFSVHDDDFDENDDDIENYNDDDF